MVFLIQNSQNREPPIRLKLDEIIRSIQLAHNEMINIEKLSDEELQALSNKGVPPLSTSSNARLRGLPDSRIENISATALGYSLVSTGI